MDHQADRVHSATGRHDYAWLVAVTVVVSAVLTFVCMEIVSVYREQGSSMALVSSGGPTTVEPERSQPAAHDGASPAADDRASPATGDAATTTTDSATSSGMKASRMAAAAPMSVAPSASPVVGERGRWALAQISYPWQEMLPGWTIEFDEERDGLFGLTLVDDQRIEIYVRDDQSDELLVHIVAHELGHAVDVTLNNGPDRRAWQAARGIEDEPWWPNSGASDFHTGAGDFAESFAYWQAESDSFRSKLGSAPSPEQLELVARLAGG